MTTIIPIAYVADKNGFDISESSSSEYKALNDELFCSENLLNFLPYYTWGAIDELMQQKNITDHKSLAVILIILIHIFGKDKGSKFTNEILNQMQNNHQFILTKEYTIIQTGGQDIKEFLNGLKKNNQKQQPSNKISEYLVNNHERLIKSLILKHMTLKI